MKNSKIIIVEDDPFIAEDLKEILKISGYINVFTCNCYSDLLKELQKNEFDLALVHIHLNDKTDGIEIANILKKEHCCSIIFVTAYTDQSTLDKVSEIIPQGYISKPYNQADVLISVELALRRGSEKFNQRKQESNDVIFVKTVNGTERIKCTHIFYLEANDYYSFIHLEDRKILVLSTLKQLEKDLNFSSLCRIHRSFIVNISKVNKFSRYELELGELKLPISRSYKDQFLEKIKSNFS